MDRHYQWAFNGLQSARTSVGFLSFSNSGFLFPIWAQSAVYSFF